MIVCQEPLEMPYMCEGLAGAVLICAQPSCIAHGMLCGRAECECMKKHLGHDMLTITELEEMLRVLPTLPTLQKSVNRTIDRWISKLEDLKTSHNEHIQNRTHAIESRCPLRRRLLTRGQVKA